MVLHMLFLIIMQKSKFDSYDSLSLEKRLTFHNAIILIKLVFIKNQNHYYYNILLVKG